MVGFILAEQRSFYDVLLLFVRDADLVIDPNADASSGLQIKDARYRYRDTGIAEEINHVVSDDANANSGSIVGLGHALCVAQGALTVEQGGSG